MRKKLIVLAAVLAGIFAFTGCKMTDSLLLDASPVVTPAATNTVTGDVTPAVTNTSYAPKAGVDGALQAGESLAPLLPPPYAPVAAGVLALLSAGLGAYARSKNAKLTTSNAIVRSIVAGVEAAGQPETKAAIQNVASAAGVQSELHSIVQGVSLEMK